MARANWRTPIRDAHPEACRNASVCCLGRLDREKQEGPCQAYLTGPMKPAITYFPAEQYHRR